MNFKERYNPYSRPVTVGDLLRVVEKLRQGYGRRVFSMLLPARASERVALRWSNENPQIRHWWEIAQIRREWNRAISGDPEIDHTEHLSRSLFQHADLSAYSICSGEGGKEIGWAKTGAFKRIDAVDISTARVARAAASADREGVGHIVRFRQGDAALAGPPENSCDIVFAEGALHHILELEKTVDGLLHALRPAGYLVLLDFVGPSRFQWSPQQLDIVNDLLSRMPESLRHRWGSGSIKRRVYRPGTWSMKFVDPSEAVRSAEILDVLSARGDCIESADLGGTISHLLFDDIAHNFVGGVEEAERWLGIVLQEERSLIRSGELGSDYVFGVYRKC